MTTPEDLGYLRTFAAHGGEYANPADNRLAASVTHLLFDWTNLLCDLEEARQLLKQWGIPTKQRRAAKLDGAGFEKGWD